ncbi:MAG: hypothetical protein KatS3mg060_1176 [Dehalococcoidia bacterium]|nr:MAG: hypothetical protein KatS3mg060_1176 [Dehalococcoidia bacterium]
MSVRDRLRALGGRAPRPSSPPPRARALAGGRVTVDHGWFGLAPLALVPPPDAERPWSLALLDSRTLAALSPQRLVELLADWSPDVSRALFDFLRLTNPGWTAQALRPGSQEPDERGQAALDAFLADLRRQYGSCDVVWGRLFLSAFLRGALFVELVLDAAGRRPVDLVVPDPFTARFRMVADPVRGQVWQLGQLQHGRFVPLDRPTVRYVPIDPLPGSPYGRPLITPALFTTLFLLGLLHDLRRVVAQQGYTRLDLEIDLTQLAEAMPQLREDPAAWQAWVEELTDQVKRAYQALEPDDAFVHSNVVKVNRPVGAVDAASIGGIDRVLTSLERLAMRALKTMPMLMGTTDGVSEANANRQWEIHVAGIKSIQHHAESTLEELLGLALQAQGIPAVVRFRFAELRAAEMLRDAQTEAARIANAIAKYEAGWISHEEASLEVTGRPPAAPAPRTAVELPAVPVVNADPGADRALAGDDRRGGRLIPFRPRPGPPIRPPEPRDTVTDDEIAAAVTLWDRVMPERFRGLLDATAVGDE